MIASAFNGFNTHAWTWWVVFAVSLGPVLIWAFLVSLRMPSESAILKQRAGYLLPHLARLVLDIFLVS